MDVHVGILGACEQASALLQVQFLAIRQAKTEKGLVIILAGKVGDDLHGAPAHHRITAEHVRPEPLTDFLAVGKKLVADRLVNSRIVVHEQADQGVPLLFRDRYGPLTGETRLHVLKTDRQSRKFTKNHFGRFARCLSRASLTSAVTPSNAFSIKLTFSSRVWRQMSRISRTAASMAASEWWTCNDVPAGPTCGIANMFSGGKVTVAAGTTIVNFKLESGARIQGTMTSNATAAVLPGVQLALRDFITDEPAAFQRARDDGTFRINVRPGVYTAGARNRTLLPYASGLYNGPALPPLGGTGTATGGGGAFASEATPVTLAAAYIYTLNFPLIEGGVLSGKLTDGAAPTPNAVAGTSVRFWRLTNVNDTTGAFVEGTRTDLAGNYRLWVRAGDYAVRTRGQLATPTVVAFSANNNPAAVDFGAVVGRATATLHGPGNTPLSQVKVSLYDDPNAVFREFQITNGDGTVQLHAQPTGDYRIEYKVDNGSTSVGSAIHNGTANPTGTQLLQGTLVLFDTAAAPTALGTITLPAGGELKGVVTLAGAAIGNIVVQVRSGNVTGAQRFTATRTQKDGSYSLSVPAGTYNRVCAFVPGTAGACPAGTPTLAGTFASADNVAVIANQSNTLNIAIP